MSEQQRSQSRFDDQELGASFEAHNSQSFGEDVGAAFASKTSEDARDAVKRVRGRRSRVWILVSIILAVAVVLFIVYFFSGGKSPGAGAGPAAGGGRGQNGPAAVATGLTESGDMPVYVQALGTVTPLNTVSLYSQITGRVMKVYYREGQIVTRGQPLIDIDPRPYEATLAQAQGTLQHDQSVLAQARIDLTRYQAAYARNAIAKQLLDDQEQLVLQDEGTVTTDEANIRYDQVQLGYCHIVAPITGRTGLRLVDVGNTVFSGSSSTLVVITQLNPITVVFNVSEDDLPLVEQQLKARGSYLTVDAFDRTGVNKLASGRLTSLDNEVDTTTGTVKFRATFENRGNVFYPNQFVNARLLVRTLRGVTLVPTAAVQHNGTQAFLYVVRPGKKGGDAVYAQNVTAETNNDTVTAVQGIGTGITVATSGFDRLENGAEVKVANGRPGAAAAGTRTSTGGPGRTAEPSGTNDPNKNGVTKNGTTENGKSAAAGSSTP